MTTAPDEALLIEALRRGDQDAFAQLIDAHTPGLMRVIGASISTTAVAEDLVQETWMAFMRSIANSELGASLRTRLFAMAIHIAEAHRIDDEREPVALSATLRPTVNPDRFHGPDEPNAGAWNEPPRAFPEAEEGSVLERQLRVVAEQRLRKLAPQQQRVVILRDLLGFDAIEVSTVLAITVAQQRVLLHQGRAAVRQALEDHVCG